MIGAGSRRLPFPAMYGAANLLQRVFAPHPALRATFSHEGRRDQRRSFALLPLWEKVALAKRRSDEGGKETSHVLPVRPRIPPVKGRAL